MPLKDMREFIRRLENEKELVRISSEVAPEPDVGAMGRAAADLEREGFGPAILCENVAGFQTPLVFGLHASQRRVAMVLDQKKDINSLELFREFSKRYDRYPVEPRHVNKAPCKEVVKVGEKADLIEFPIVRWNTRDAAPFITKGNVITKDASGLVNVGLYRIQLKNRKQLSLPTIPSHDIGRQAHEARKMGKKELEVAIAIGNDPTVQLAACSPIPQDWSEYSYAGALRGEPLEVVKGETVDLPVPAHSEIIIEGHINLANLEVEGPFAEFPGYYSHVRQVPLVDITAITHREKPIFEGLYIGRPWTECDYMSHMPNSIAIYKQAKLLAPELRAFNLASTWCMVGVASMTKSYAGQDKKVMNAVLASRHAAYGMKVLLIVDDDIDPFDLNDVLWAMSSRFNPDKDIITIPDATRNPLDPTIPGKGYGAKLVLDMTEPKPPEPVPAVGIVNPPPKTDEWKQRLKQMLAQGKRGS